MIWSFLFYKTVIGIIIWKTSNQTCMHKIREILKWCMNFGTLFPIVGYELLRFKSQRMRTQVQRSPDHYTSLPIKLFKAVRHACLPDAKYVLNTGSWGWEMVRRGEQRSLQQNSRAEAQLWNNPLWVQWELTQLSTAQNQALNICRTVRDVCRRDCLRISYWF